MHLYSRRIRFLFSCWHIVFYEFEFHYIQKFRFRTAEFDSKIITTANYVKEDPNKNKQRKFLASILVSFVQILDLIHFYRNTEVLHPLPFVKLFFHLHVEHLRWREIPEFMSNKKIGWRSILFLKIKRKKEQR